LGKFAFATEDALQGYPLSVKAAADLGAMPLLELVHPFPVPKFRRKPHMGKPIWHRSDRSVLSRGTLQPLCEVECALSCETLIEN